MCPEISPVANLFGGSLGFTLNKRQSIEREKSGHTPAKKKHLHTCRASSVRARLAIQEALAVKMSSLHIDDSLSRRVELPDNCRTMIVTPDGDEDDKQRIIDDSADDSDYDDATVANPTHKSLPKNIRNKKSEPKLTLDHNFMCFLRPHTFDHKLFRRGKEDIYSIAKMERFDADYRRQLHFNFWQHGPLRKRSKHSTRLVLDVSVTSILMPSQIIPHRHSALASAKIFRNTYWRTYWTAPLVVDSLYALRRNYMETARAIQSDFRIKGLPVETWRMSSKR